MLLVQRRRGHSTRELHYPRQVSHGKQAWSQIAGLTCPVAHSDMAMSNLLACERPSVRALMVKGDMVVDEENRNSEPWSGEFGCEGCY